MSSVRASIPSESDLLCEGCGYVLNGLPPGTRCPECGKPGEESAGSLRVAPLWESETQSFASGRFLRTGWDVIIHPIRFYKTLATRRTRQSSSRFAQASCALSSLLFGAAACVHLNWYLDLARVDFQVGIGGWLLLTVATYLFLVGTIRLAAWLTHWEASYRGYRLPLSVVRRGLDYHTAHYLPVAILTTATVIGHDILLRRHLISILSDPAYLYTLSAEVLISAFYLFETYWVGMRNMLYANA